MKKLLAVLMAMSLLLVFAGCKNEDDSEKDTTVAQVTDVQAETKAPAAEDKEHDSKLIGTWKMQEDDGTEKWYATLEYNKDGTYCMYQTDEQVRTYIEADVAEKFKTEDQLNNQLEVLGLKTKEDLINKLVDDYVRESKPQEKTYLYWKTENGQIKYYTSKADYESGNYDKDMTKNYKISEDGKVLTSGNIKLGNPDSYDSFDKVS